MRLVLHSFMSLDGVVQAPGDPGEDVDGGFAFGGWTATFADPDFGETMVRWVSGADAFLLGRRTYEIFAGYWPTITDTAHPIATPLNALPKYVATRTAGDLAWEGTRRLGDNVVDEIRALKRAPGRELQVHGSGELAQLLMREDLVDEYRLLTFPVHLGAGKRLFRDALPAGALRNLGSHTTDTGVIVATYVPNGAVVCGSVPDGDDPTEQFAR